MFDFDSEKKLVFESDLVRVYETTVANSLTKDCYREFPTMYLKPLKGFHVYAVEEKDSGVWHYVLYNDKGEPVYAHSQLDSISMHITFLRRALTEK